MTQIPAAMIAAQVLADGGSLEQAWVAAALASGVESNGDPTDKNPSSTACGLFQFLDTTWQANGGTGTSACSASWQEQVAVFVTASGGPGGNNFYPWKPDFIQGGGPQDYDGKPAPPPEPGSPVANAIASLAAGGTLSKILGNVPAQWASSGAAEPGTPTPNPLVNAPSGQAGAPAILSGLSGLESGVDAVLTTITSVAFWERVGMGVLGAALFTVGLIGFISTTKPGERATSDLGTAAKDAAVATVAA